VATGTLDTSVLPSAGFFTLSGTGLTGRLIGSADMALPAPGLEAFAADAANPVLPTLDLTATGLSGGVGATNPVFGLELPAVGLAAGSLLIGSVGSLVGAQLPIRPELAAAFAATGGSMPVIDRIDLSGTLLNGAIGGLAASLPVLGMTGALVDLDAGALTSSITLPRLGITATGGSGGNGLAELLLPALAVSGQAIVGVAIAQDDLVLPGLGLQGTSFTVATLAGGLLDLPMPVLGGPTDGDGGGGAVAIGQAPVTGTVLVMNARTGAVSLYDTFAFNSFAIAHGRQLSAGAAGIYSLGGEQDAGADIDMALVTGASDGGNLMVKRVREVFFGYRTNGRIELRVRADDGEWYAYPMDETRVDGLYRNRVKVGRGLKGSYFQFQVRNTGGCDVSIDAIEPAMEPLSVRTR
jgi:hypothetical protein